MGLPTIPDKWKNIWDLWNLRGCILFSLSLQAFLVICASLRQRFRSTPLLFFIWSAYLLADWVAAVAIGQITQSQGGPSDHSKEIDHDFYAFWASFLLLHLGGPDSITSFALEDNEFWIRHLFGLILQSLAASYSFYLTLPDNKLWLPTILVFVVGIIKYAERTRALYLASLDCFGATVLPEANPGPDYEETVAIYSSLRTVQVLERREAPDPDFSVEGTTPLDDSDDMNLLLEAYKLFETFKGLIVGFFLSSIDRESSRKIFLNTDHSCAFRLIEFELSFMYQVLHTKAVVVHSKIGYILRLICFSFIFCALTLFFLVEKHGFGKFNTSLTYALLLGAIVLDVTSIVKLIFSDWILATLKDICSLKLIPSIILRRRRWSETVFQYNMISYSLDEHRPAIRVLYKLAGFLRIRGIAEKIKIMHFSTSELVTENLKGFVFKELKRKSEKAVSLKDGMEVCSQRGDSALLDLHPSNYIKLKWSIGEFQYAETLLLWHLATELCCSKERNTSPDRRSRARLANLVCCHKQDYLSAEEGKGKRICKLLSDYMFYLLVMQPSMLSPVLGNWYVVFQDTRSEAQRFFDKYKLSNHSEACNKIFTIKAKFRPAAVKGTKSKSVFFDACILAQQLHDLEDRWRVMARVWMELMSFAAINCRPIVHAQQPSRGGELLTLTWLMMNHLGLGTQFSHQEEQIGTKMVALN